MIDTPRARPKSVPGRRVRISGVLVFIFFITASHLKADPPISPPQDLTLNFQNTDLDLVLKFFSEATGQIFLKSDAVRGFVTVVAPGRVPLPEALKILQAVLNLKGFAMSTGPGNIIRILTQAEAAQASMNLSYGENENSVGDGDQMITHMIPIKFASNLELKQQLQPLLSKDGTMIVDERTNALIVTDLAPNVRRLVRTIEKLDVRTPQVLIEALIMEVSLTDETKLGIEWGYNDVLHGSDHSFKVETGQSFSLGSIITEGFKYSILRDDARLSAMLMALATNKTVNILSTPHIMTLNNQTASIRVGEEVPVLTQTRNIQGGETIRSFDYKPVAIELEVTPRINSDRDILMKVHPLIKKILGYNPELNAPILATREAQTSVLIKDGQTVVIGGLMKDDRSVSDSKIPLLGDLPLIGAFFKRSSHTNEKTELLVFVTPRVVTTVAEAQTVTVDKESQAKSPNVPHRLDAKTYWNVGQVYYRQKKYSEAIQEWDRALEICPDAGFRQKIRHYRSKALRKSSGSPMTPK